MSVLLRDPTDGKIKLLIKGADSIIKSRLDTNQLPHDMSQKVEWFLETASKQGLRTLLMGMKVVTEQEKDSFLKECLEAEKDLINREAKLDEIYSHFETKIVLVGATAVEDRLQDDVPQTIHSLQQAGIKIWMLTGDKLETAENIGESCKLLHPHNMIIKRLSNDLDVVRFCTENSLKENRQRIKEGKMMGLLVEAQALETITQNELFKAAFLQISKTCEAVICCRVSPG
jgi:phospholipid-transporting ATPase